MKGNKTLKEIFDELEQEINNLKNRVDVLEKSHKGEPEQEN